MKRYTKVYAPVSGKTRDVTTLSDPVFAEKLVGDGVAIDPSDDIVRAPCGGKLNHLFDTCHAFTMLTEDGAELLVHMGIETVELKGKGFKKLISDPEATLEAGEPMIEMDRSYIESQGKETSVIVIVSDSESDCRFKKKLDCGISAGEELFRFKAK